MNARCRRCDWTGPDKAQLALHALDSGHPLCPICHRSQADTDPAMACEHCLTDTRALLSGIVTMYAELPAHLGRSTGPLPGGDPLVMLSAGSEGVSETGETSRPSDPPSVSFELGWWAIALQDERDDPKPLGHTPSRIVINAAGYLEVHARWAANSWSGFPELHADLQRLHHRLERAVARDLPEQHANADCFDCGGPLVRKADPATGVMNPEAPVECRICREEYDEQRYRLALRVQYEDADVWLPLTEAARLAGARVETVETWAKRGQVESACRLPDGRKLVHWPDVRRRQRELQAQRVERAARDAQLREVS